MFASVCCRSRRCQGSLRACSRPRIDMFPGTCPRFMFAACRFAHAHGQEFAEDQGLSIAGNSEVRNAPPSAKPNARRRRRLAAAWAVPAPRTRCTAASGLRPGRLDCAIPARSARNQGVVPQRPPSRCAGCRGPAPCAVEAKTAGGLRANPRIRAHLQSNRRHRRIRLQARHSLHHGRERPRHPGCNAFRQQRKRHLARAAVPARNARLSMCRLAHIRPCRAKESRFSPCSGQAPSDARSQAGLHAYSASVRFATRRNCMNRQSTSKPASQRIPHKRPLYFRKHCSEKKLPVPDYSDRPPMRTRSNSGKFSTSYVGLIKETTPASRTARK